MVIIVISKVLNCCYQLYDFLTRCSKIVTKNANFVNKQFTKKCQKSFDQT